MVVKEKKNLIGSIMDPDNGSTENDPIYDESMAGGYSLSTN